VSAKIVSLRPPDDTVTSLLSTFNSSLSAEATVVTVRVLEAGAAAETFNHSSNAAKARLLHSISGPLTLEVDSGCGSGVGSPLMSCIEETRQSLPFDLLR
jgi:hypothetical protein